jgi:hypothetical protein
MPTIDDFQKNLNRRPLVEIISSNFLNDIPFDGQFLTTNDEDETHPGVIIHSSGRLMLVFVRASTDTALYPAEIHYKYTDTVRNEFQPVVTWEAVSGNTSTIESISLVEMGDTNVAVIWAEHDGTNYHRRYRIITEVGVLVSQGEIQQWADTLGDFHSSNVIRLA